MAMQRMISALTVSSLVAMLALAACQTAPADGGLLPEARNAVSQAQADPNVTKYSANELNRARQLLGNAEGSAKENGATDKVTAHYAYLAMQTARIAGQRAQEQVAMARIKAGDTERQQILLAARESEARQARSDAQDAQLQVAQAQAESQRLAKQLEDMQASQTSRGIVLTLGDVLFDTGSADLKPGAARPIGQVAQFLSEHPERKVQIEGFTDSQGADQYNLELSQKRADAVAMAIMQRGVTADRVRALGYGEEYPKASNSSAGSRQLNRRVEIIVSNGDQSIPGRAASGSP
jgi:outer membrane protein OmpA-like peptidoglycan-associated protein